MNQIKALIDSEVLNMGDTLPSVRHVAAELQVNPMTVSKAYNRLSYEGFIEKRHGIGMIVCQQSQKSYALRRHEIKGVHQQIVALFEA